MREITGLLESDIDIKESVNTVLKYVEDIKGRGSIQEVMDSYQRVISNIIYFKFTYRFIIDIRRKT